jgi:2-polyprenyl-3-methyl-5-hydroxy-6-metoxy-1,4-benzoquinol methylase
VKWLIACVFPAILMACDMTTEEIDAINKRCYDNQANRWQRFPFAEFLPEWVLQYQNREAGLRALDIGSGVGNFALWLSEEGFNVLCLEPSDEMVRRCSERNLTVLQTTIQDYQDKASFGLITAICSLIHVPKRDFPPQIEKIAALLPSGGIFMLAMIEGSSEGLLETDSEFPRFFSTYSQEEIIEATATYFSLLDFRRHIGSNGRAYLVFALKKIGL